MKTETISKVCEHINITYRFTFHPLFNGESGLIEIEERFLVRSWFKKKYFWKRIYFGHTTPIEESMKFYNESLKK